jgi:hypothetical protein
MRGERGKLVCVWSPVLHGEGCSTLACSIGLGAHHITGSRVLIVNKSSSISSVESFLEKDIKIKYSMDNLKIFGTEIRTDHILTYATQINTDLYMIAGSRLDKEITGENEDFERLFINSCLEGFDLTIVDLDTGIREKNSLYLDSADKIISVFTPNEIVLDKLFKEAVLRPALDYFTDNRTVHVINRLHSSWETKSVLNRYKSRYSLSHAFGLDYNGELLNACCTDRAFYSFCMKELNSRRRGYIKQLDDICSFLASDLSMAEKSTEGMNYGASHKRLRKISLY